MGRLDWQSEAACDRYPDPDSFFLDGHTAHLEEMKRREAARLACMGCPVRLACLEFALVNKEPFGLWGGLWPKERRSLLASRERRTA